MGLLDAGFRKALEGLVSPSALRAAEQWLNQNEEVATTLLSIAAGPAALAGTQATVMLIKWLASKNSKKSVDGSTTLSQIPIGRAVELAGALSVAERWSGAKPGRNVREVGGKLEVVRPERRVGLGITRQGNAPQPVLLLSSGSDALPSWITRDLPSPPQVLVVGQAAALQPSEDANKPLTVPLGEHRPGRSIAHREYIAGSVGAYVIAKDEGSGREVKGFLGAAHVLSNMGRADLRDRVLSPGYPDRARDAKYTYGTLENWRELVHHSSQTDPDLIVNHEDIAHASLIDGVIEPTNDVPDPNDPKGNLLPTADCMSLMELRDHTHSEVFMIGRTTAFARGRLVATDIEEFPIRMPNGRNYMFGGLALVESQEEDRRFSQGGDSGAMVYALDGRSSRALGFVVGGSERYTYIVPAVTCLSAMGVTLL
jgi:hypothetical protein